MSGFQLLGPLDPNFAWDGRRLYGDRDLGPCRPAPRELRGAATVVVGDESGRWRLLRDPLGLNKLFWARSADATLVVAARPQRLVEAGVRFEELTAFPRGYVADFEPAGGEAVQHSIVPEAWSSNPESALAVDEAARMIRSAISRYLAAIASAHPSARPFVCLSGGLDSSGIVVLVREHFAEVTAVSFDLERDAGRKSEDRATAERLARDLGLELIIASVTEDELLEKLDLVLVEGIDWRDFNVHAALVNAALAEAIDEALGSRAYGEEALVFTGDLANEFLADYHPERYGGATFYELPRLPPAPLRASLVRGVETSHREIGVFAAWGLPVVQPYAVAVDAYLGLPGDFLRLSDAKPKLSERMFGDLVPEYVYTRPKVRAQIGSTGGGGVLAACVDRGIDARWLRRRFAELHGLSDERALGRFMRGGRYQASVPQRQGGGA
jgi:asparagine synthetase B (glutamine-hydrolysing)